MPYTVLSNFGAGGYSSDRHEETLEPGAWGQMTNLDIHSTELSSPGRDVAAFTGCPIQPKWTYFYRTAQGGYYFVSDGTDTYYNDSSSGWVEIASGWGGGLVTYTVFLGTLIINSTTDGPYYWVINGDDPAYDTWESGDPESWEDGQDIAWSGTPDASQLRPLPGWFENATCLMIIAYSNFLVAIAVDRPDKPINTGPYRLAWSAAAVTGTVPVTWVPSAENLAGDRLIQDTPGALTGAGLMRDSLIAYKNDSIYRMTFTGNFQIPMVIERVHTCDGIDYPDALAVCSDMHYLATRAGITRFDGQQVVPLDFGKIQEAVRQFFAAASEAITAGSVYPSNEQVWIAYKIPGVDTYQGIVKYDIQNNSFVIHDYSAEGLTALTAGQTFDDMLGQDDSWAGGDASSWEAGPDIPWVPKKVDPIQDTVLMAVSSGTTVRYDPYGDPLRLNGNPKEVKATKYGIRLAESTHRVLVKGLYPLMRGEGQLIFKVGRGYQQWHDGGPTQMVWGPERPFTPGVDRRLPLRDIAGNFAISIESRDGKPWRLAGIGIEYQVLGERG